MNFSDQLEDAVLEESIGEVDDVLKSLNTLVKVNHGLWKSEKQARFLLNKLDSNLFKDRAAEAYAHRKGLQGHAFSHMAPLKGYGIKDPSKIRYSGMFFVVDNGGVVYRAKVKVIHPTKGGRGLSLDWSSVKTTFERTKRPEILVDPKAELIARISKNQPDIDMIKSIPGWETKDILVSFLQQLERGHPLSFKQRAVIQKMVPSKELFIGDKEKWKKTFARFKHLVVFRVYLPMLQAFKSEYGKYEGSKEKKDPFAAFDSNGETWGDWYSDMIDGYKAGIREASKWNFAYSPKTSWLHNKAVWNLFHLFSKGVTPESGVDSFAEITLQVEKAIKAKSPTKKALGVIGFVARATDGLEGMSVEQAIKKVA